MQSAEIELKFPIADLARLQSLLPGLGFQLDTPRTFEQNTLYDTPARALRRIEADTPRAQLMAGFGL